MRRIKAIAATFLLLAPAQAADLPSTMATPTGEVAAYGVSNADMPTVSACHGAISQWAAQYDPIDVRTSMTGPIRGRSGEERVATLFVEIDYEREGGVEPRSATILCTVAADGSVSVAEAP